MKRIVFVTGSDSNQFELANEVDFEQITANS